MKKELKNITLVAAMIVAVASAAQAQTTASISSTTGYTQNFNSLGTSATSIPTAIGEWTAYNITTGGDANTQWETSIPASQVGGGTQITTVTSLTDTSIGTSKSGSSVYNIADATVGTSNRALSTSPTGDDGIALQLSLTNTGTTSINSIAVAYNIKKYTDGILQGPTAGLPNNEELPGYELFYSVNGGAYTNVAQFNPVASNAANPNNQPVIPVGTPSASGSSSQPVDYTVTNVSGTITLAQAVAAGQTLTFRWVDDNGVNVSPDQQIGLDDVSINAATPTPIPAAFWLLGSGLMGLFGMRRKKQN
jgi:hypothetical protein